MTTDLIEDYLSHLRSLSASPRTTGERRKILTRMDAELPMGLDVACEDELRAWLWQEGWTPGTRETYHSAMVGFFRWAVKLGEIDFDPSAEIAKPKVPRRLPRPVTDEQLVRLLAAPEPYRLWVQIAAYAGARCIEISRLHREHITQDGVRLHGKNNKLRHVPTHPVVWEAVKDLPGGPLTEHDERHISMRSAIYFRRSMHMPGVSLHRCRHWFGTQVQRRHKDLRVTQELMGHADPSTTAGYALVADEDKATAIALLPDLSAGGQDDDGRTPRMSSAR